MDCSVTVASNGKEALDCLDKDKFDLVFMDCQMPVMDGYEASKKIKKMIAKKEVPDIPIVALTASIMPGNREKCLAAGMDGYIAKPANKIKLQEAMHMWVMQSSAYEEIMHKQEENTTVSDIPDSKVIEDAKEAMRDKFIQAIQYYIEDTGEYICQMKNALEKGDIKQIILLLHTIKSSSHQIGARQVYNSAKDMETQARNIMDNKKGNKAEELSSYLSDLKKEFERAKPEYKNIIEA